MNYIPLVTVGLFAGSVGILLGIVICLFAVKKAANEKVMLEHKVEALSSEVLRAHEEHGRFEEIVRHFPRIVKRLSQPQGRDAVPFNAVRVAREFLGATKVAYLAPVAGTNEFVVAESVGYPPEWKGTLRVSGETGLLAASTRDGAVLTRADCAARANARSGGPSDLEEAMGAGEFVIPVVGVAKRFGVLVAAGTTAVPAGERPLAAMLADLVACAFQCAIVGETIERRESADPLTRLADKAYFLGRLEQEVRRARNYEIPLSLVLLDVDGLQKIDDGHGAAAGDAVMSRMAGMIRASTRCTDVAARCGGKEFALLMTTSDKEGAFLHAERLREAVAVGSFDLEGHADPVKVTVSGGVATFPEDGDSADALVRAAGEALAKAVEAGCNRVLRARRAG